MTAVAQMQGFLSSSILSLSPPPFFLMTKGTQEQILFMSQTLIFNEVKNTTFPLGLPGQGMNLKCEFYIPYKTLVHISKNMHSSHCRESSLCS